MRLLKAGLILLLLISATATAQVSGTVESIGFDAYIRPDCWTPMVITVTPETAKNDTYEVHVRLQDLDRDLPIFSRQITVTGATEGRTRTDRFRMYFMPSPTDGGLPDASDPGSLKDLQERLKVSLHHATGKKEWICDLPITGTVRNVDLPERFARGHKLIVAVSDGKSRPIYLQSSEVPFGVMEDVDLVTIQPRDLPESVLGYDAADAIVWCDADPGALRSGGDDKFKALEQYVRRGGRLVICQPFDWQKILGFENMLPVTVLGVEEKEDLQPLRSMAAPPPAPPLLGVQNYSQPSDPLRILTGPFRFARAEAKPNTVVSQWITWKDNDYSPYIVRMPFGLGQVTWVAQDLGDPSLTKTRTGWVPVWDRVFDWKNSPIIQFRETQEVEIRPWTNATQMDVGKSLIERWMDLQSKSAWLVTLAVLFFVGYWLIAGPGTYAYLATRRKTHLSWFVFGLCAFIATGLTILMVKLVLRGPPELKHFSVVRMAPGQPAEVISRIGLYIPRDGQQRIELKDVAPGEVSSITALPINPAFLREAPEQTGPEYTVPVPEPGEAAAISVPYRSTLKKFQATWIGTIDGSVQGSVKLTAGSVIEGRLTNGTGHALTDIYIAYNIPPGATFLPGDFIWYMPSWDAGITIDLARDFAKREDGTTNLPLAWTDQNKPNGYQKARGRIEQEWSPLWTEKFGGNLMETNFDDTPNEHRNSLAMLSFFDRMPPMKNRTQTQYQLRGAAASRVEIRRRGGRWLEMSQALSAGQLVVLAQSQGPLPFPMEVEGQKVTGDGLILYQFALPLDRSAVASTTQPTTQPLTR